MPAAVLAAGWDTDHWRPRPQALVAPEVLSRAGTSAPQEHGPHIWGVKQRWEPVEGRLARSQTGVPAVRAHRALMAGGEGVGQPPALQAEEAA
jgi:hypothetical protein